MLLKLKLFWCCMLVDNVTWQPILADRVLCSCSVRSELLRMKSGLLQPNLWELTSTHSMCPDPIDGYIYEGGAV